MNIQLPNSDTEANSGRQWNIDGVVGALRDLRVKALASRQRLGRPPRLPSRKALAAILEGLSSALYPNRLGSGNLTDEGVDYFVGQTLDSALWALFEQVRRECRFTAEQNGEDGADCERKAADIVRAFAAGSPACVCCWTVI